eukprot:2929715-Pyramimonas_sp.AAC.1
MVTRGGQPYLLFQEWRLNQNNSNINNSSSNNDNDNDNKTTTTTTTTTTISLRLFALIYSRAIQHVYPRFSTRASFVFDRIPL